MLGHRLLGLGGSGTLRGTVKGPIETPQVVASIAGSGGRYNNVLLGDAATLEPLWLAYGVGTAPLSATPLRRSSSGTARA